MDVAFFNFSGSLTGVSAGGFTDISSLYFIELSLFFKFSSIHGNSWKRIAIGNPPVSDHRKYLFK